VVLRGDLIAPTCSKKGDIEGIDRIGGKSGCMPGASNGGPRDSACLLPYLGARQVSCPNTFQGFLPQRSVAEKNPNSLIPQESYPNLEWIEQVCGGSVCGDRRSFVEVVKFKPAPVVMVYPRPPQGWGRGGYDTGRGNHGDGGWRGFAPPPPVPPPP
jgi:hypothetical protein